MTLTKNVFALLILLFVFSPTQASDLINLTPEQLLEQQKAGALIIDVRTPPEWKQTGIIPGSKTMMFFDERGKYDAQQWINAMQKEKTSLQQPVILVCRSGNRTHQIGSFLTKQLGMTNVLHLQHGIKSWIKEKRPVEAYTGK